MIKATMNQLHNISNKYQTSAKKVLSVCSAGMLRSPTIANVLNQEYSYNTRSCGIHDYALIPISEALIRWADEIIFVDYETYETTDNETSNLIKIQQELGTKIIILSIPDNYEWNDKQLVHLISEQYKAIL